jgi:L-ascorbate metabolism protein UlaG (beta-lactamase superfamily)
VAAGAGNDPPAPPSPDRIDFLGHATVLIELDATRVLTDPVLRDHVVHLRRRRPSIDPGAVRGVDAVLVSHLHHDHLDLASLRLLGRDRPLFVPAGAAAWLRAKGFTAVTGMAAGDVARVGAIEVRAVPAHHDGRRLGGPPAESLGFVVRGRRAVYFAGDTEVFDAMADLAPGLDVALLPVAGWGPTLGPGHMDPADAARAAVLLRPRIAIPIHWGTLAPLGMGRRMQAILTDPPQRFAERVAQLAPAIEVRILQPGQATEL